MRCLQRPIVRLIAGALLLSVLLMTYYAVTLTSAKAKKGPDPSQTNTWNVPIGTQSGDLATQGMAFLPPEIWVNVGDTVGWTSQSADFHTVTFLAKGQQRPPFFNPNDPSESQRVGGDHYDGVTYYNSGIMIDNTSRKANYPPGVTPYTTYQLTFDTTGDFTYICLVHSMMQAVVHVRLAGTIYPYTQKDYDHQAKKQAQDLLKDGNNLTTQATAESSNLNVTDGIGDNYASVMRIFPQNITVHVNDTITFTNREGMDSHTVTFGEPPTPNFFPFGNPAAFDGQTPLNSGALAPGQTYQVTFIKAGTYAFRCDFHDYMGMDATITVLP